MKHVYRVTYKDVRNCFLYVPQNAAEEEEFVKMAYGKTGTSYFSVVYGTVKDSNNWSGYVGLNASYAKDLGLSPDELVSLTFIKSLPKLSCVNCIHSSDDLDILELSKDQLEKKILGQIKVVWPGQTFPVWLGKNFIFNVKVESLRPPCSVGILCDGTELDLRPGPDFHRVQSIAHQEEDDVAAKISLGSVEFRACQMPDGVEEGVAGADAAVYATDWPSCWGTSPRSVLCTFSRPQGSTSVNAILKPLTDQESAIPRVKLPLRNILFSRALLAALGLTSNGHPVRVAQQATGSSGPPLPVPVPAEQDKPLWEPLFIGSLLHLVEEGEASVELALRLTPTAEAFNPLITPQLSHNVLIFGGRGSGRSTLAQEVCHRLAATPHFAHVSAISCRSLVGKRPDACGRVLRTALDECFLCQPSVLLLDDLDCLAPHVKPSEEATAEGIHSTRIGELVSGIVWEAVRGCGGDSNRVAVMATALSPRDLSTQLVSARGAHAFTTTLCIPELDSDAREMMLAAMLGCQDCFSGDGTGAEINLRRTLHDISLRTTGFVAVDLADLVERAMYDALKRQASGRRTGEECTSAGSDMTLACVEAEDLESALWRTAPLSLHGAHLVEGGESEGGKELWGGVGGLQGAKRKLEEVVVWPLQYPELFKDLPLKPRRGVLLYGPPGTGKTHLVSSLVGHCGLRLINVKGPELLSKYIGASEEAVRNIFQKAYSARPCILFFDEFESLAPRRGHDSTGVTDRVVNQLLTQLDGVEEGISDGMVMVAATTRPDLIDPALLRPGRLDTPVLCPLPDEEDRLSILRELGSRLSFGVGVDLPQLAKLTAGFTGADLQALLYTSQLVALKSGNSDKSHFSGKASMVVEWSHILESLRQTKPSLTTQEAKKYERSYEALRDSSVVAALAGMKVSLA